MESNNTITQLRLDLIQLQRKYLVLQAESLGYQHALLGIDEERLTKELGQMKPSIPSNGSDVTLANGDKIGTFLAND